MRDNIASVFHQPGVVPHPADPNVRENVPHARHLEPEASKECIYQEEKEHCKVYVPVL